MVRDPTHGPAPSGPARIPAALAAARVAVTHDLSSTAYDDVVAAALDSRTWWLAQWPQGAPFVRCLLAQDVQEAVNEVNPLWPACPEQSCPERGAHPLRVEPDLGPDPFWVCHRTGLPIAQVGELPL